MTTRTPCSAASAAAVLESVDNERLSSGPDAVARKIVKAASAKHPRSRYPAGKGARMIMGTRRVLPDSAFDAILKRAYLKG